MIKIIYVFIFIFTNSNDRETCYPWRENLWILFIFLVPENWFTFLQIILWNSAMKNRISKDMVN